MKRKRPKRVELSEKEVIERMKNLPEREEAIRAAIREGAHRNSPSRLLSTRDYEGLMEDLDHLLLACEIAKRKARDKGERIPWEKIKATYGL